ncbi:MAG TPA: hypothetical protein VKZ18_10205 [Polyangia bacterium]|nr:hypothetical protein [Polyangia bacterium]
MATPRTALLSARRVGFALLYLATLALFARELGQFSDRQTGLSSLVLFGDHFTPRRLPQLADVPLYTYEGSDGYDGQFYAQIAAAATPFDPALARALDAPAYREGRILLPLVVHALGRGRPARIIQLFALANLVCLGLLAALLARWWFPPGELDDLLRWVGSVFGAGMVVSATRSLTDGPALLVIAIAVRQLEKGRDGPAALLLALAGLVRETSVLAIAALWPSAPTGEARRKAIRLALVAAGPIFLWTAVLAARYGHTDGLRNLAPPFLALPRKARELVASWHTEGFSVGVRSELLVLTGLAVQVWFIATRRRPGEPWWRVGASFSLFVPLLGWPVWEGFPSSAARVLLPLTLAFNRLVPRGRGGLALLVAGNLGVATLPALVDSVTASEQTTFAGGVTARYETGWFPPEHEGRETWRWASGPAVLALYNPGVEPRAVTLDLKLRAVTARTITVGAGTPGVDLRRVLNVPASLLPVHLGPFLLPPGRTEITFSTERGQPNQSGVDQRPLAFSLHRFFVNVAPGR